jgi:hypothetical protein
MWFLFAFCGVAPIMLTLVQRGFYMVPAFPFFAIAFSFLLLPLIENMKLVRLQSIKLRGVLFGIIICGAFVLTYLSYGKVWREKEQMLLVREFEAKIPEGEIVGADAVLWDNWTFQTALMRYAAVSIVKNDANRKYYIDAPGGMPLDDSWQLIYSSKTGVKILKKRY